MVNELVSGRILEGHSSHSVHIVSSLHCFFFSSARALFHAPPNPASRPATSHCLSRAPLSFPLFGRDPGGEPSHAAHQSEHPEPPLPPQVPPPRHRPPITSRARPAGPPNRGRARPPASRPSCARRRLRGRRCWASAFSHQRWERQLRRCCSRGAGQRRRAPPAGRVGASASPGPAARDPGLSRRRRPRCPGPSARREGSRPDVAGRGCPRRASRRGPQSSRPSSEGALSLPRLTCEGRLAPRCGGVCAARAPPPAASGAGAGPPAALGLTGQRVALSLTGPPAAPGRAS